MLCKHDRNVLCFLGASDAPLMSPLQGYGGYLALMMLKSTEKLISCAAVCAPVTDWSMYGEQEFESSLIQRSRDAEIFITSAAAAEPG